MWLSLLNHGSVPPDAALLTEPADVVYTFVRPPGIAQPSLVIDVLFHALEVLAGDLALGIAPLEDIERGFGGA